MDSDKNGHSVVCDDNLSRQTFSRTYNNKTYVGNKNHEKVKDIFSEADDFSKPNRSLCKYHFEGGHCDKGKYCDFSHTRPICDHFQKGICRYGESCWKSHEKVQKTKSSSNIKTNCWGDNENVYSNYLNEQKKQSKNDKNSKNGPKMKKSTEVCYHFMMGKCAYGENCFKSHEIPEDTSSNNKWEETKENVIQNKAKSTTPPRLQKTLETAKISQDDQFISTWKPQVTQIKTQRAVTPEAPKTDQSDVPICQHFQRGKCDFGEKCYKRHEKMPLFKPEFAPKIKESPCTENFNNVKLNKIDSKMSRNSPSPNGFEDDIFMSDTESECELQAGCDSKSRTNRVTSSSGVKRVSPINIFEVLGGNSAVKTNTEDSDDEIGTEQNLKEENVKEVKGTTAHKTKEESTKLVKMTNAEKKKLKKENRKKKNLEAAQDQIEKLREGGNKEYREGSYSAAIKLYSDAINLCGTNNPIPALFNNRAAAYLMVDNHKAALKDARKAVEYEPDNVKAHQRVVRCCVVLGKVEEGKASLRCIPPNCDKDEHRLFVNKLECLETTQTEVLKLLEMEDYAAAADKVGKILEIAHKSSYFITLKAQCLAFQQKVTEAREMLSRLDIRDPNVKTSLYHFVQGLCYYYEDDFDRAMSGFGEGKKDLAVAKHWHDQAMAMQNAHVNGNREVKIGGDLYKALNFYNSGLSIDPGNTKYMAKMYFNRSVVHAKLGNNTEAIEDCGRTITLDGSYYKAWAKRGSLYMENNNYVEAIRDFEEAYSLKCCPESFRNLEEAKKKKRKMESRKPNHYMVLGVDRKAGYEDIKKAYRSKAREFHPDKHANASDDEREEMEARMKEIAAAHSCLSDPGKKKTYDERLEREDQMDDSDYDFSDDEYDDDLFEFDVNDFFFQLFGGRFGVYMGGGGLGGRKRSNVYTFRR